MKEIRIAGDLTVIRIIGTGGKDIARYVLSVGTIQKGLLEIAGKSVTYVLLWSSSIDPRAFLGVIEPAEIVPLRIRV
jgi:hypothetical protein